MHDNHIDSANNDLPSARRQSENWVAARIRSFRYAFAGIHTLFRSTPNARVHLAAAVLAVGLGLWLRISGLEWAAVFLCIGGVISLEAVNSALETLADKVSPGFDPLIGRAKDLAAGAVLVMAIASVAVGAVIFIPPLIRFFSF